MVMASASAVQALCTRGLLLAGIVVSVLVITHSAVAVPRADAASVYRAAGDAEDDDGRLVTVPQLGFSVPLVELRRLYMPDMPGSYVLPRDAGVPSRYPRVTRLPVSQQLRVLVTGGAGFVGSHLVDRLMLMGHYVIALDNFFTGRRSNVAHWIGHENFELLRHDVVDEIHLEVDRIYHLASPASPPRYQIDRVRTIKANTVGTINMLELAERVKARVLMASTSEVYGDPEVSPQPESYWGHVNPIGPRACYDEAKRVAETLCYAYHEQHGVPVRVVRIFNTFGPRMSEDDGRVVSNFLLQAFKQTPLTIYGSGEQTRSFQYVHDLVSGMIALMESNYTLPVNIGNPEEFTINEFAEFIRESLQFEVTVAHLPAVQDDPQQRKPDITRAQTHLGWSPQFSVREGIKETAAYYEYRVKAGYA